METSRKLPRYFPETLHTRFPTFHQSFKSLPPVFSKTFGRMEGALERYLYLGVERSLSQGGGRYTSACGLLELILKKSYYKCPKPLQAVVYQDVLTAFRFLPRMPTEAARHAAITLRQGVMSALPKRKKNVAVTEFKHAIIAHTRNCKSGLFVGDLDELPDDVIEHVFGFMDFQTLVSSSEVCRSWNVASKDNRLWQSMYSNTLSISSKIDNNIHGELSEEEEGGNPDWIDNNIHGELSEEEEGGNPDWRSIFIQAYHEFSWEEVLASSSRGICERCREIIWVADLGINNCEGRHHKINLISTRQTVEYIEGNRR